MDKSFGVAGLVITPLGDWAYARGVALDSGGRIVVAGSAAANNSYFLALARYDASGSLDPSFGTGGTVMSALGYTSEAEDVRIDDSGRIVVAGNFSTPDVGPLFLVARYTANGMLDGDFNGNGWLGFDFLGSRGAAHALALDTTGKIVVVGESFDGVGDFAVARLNGDGSFDASFGNGGKRWTDFSGRSDVATAVRLTTRDGLLSPEPRAAQPGMTSR